MGHGDYQIGDTSFFVPGQRVGESVERGQDRCVLPAMYQPADTGGVPSLFGADLGQAAQLRTHHVGIDAFSPGGVLDRREYVGLGAVE